MCPGYPWGGWDSWPLRDMPQSRPGLSGFRAGPWRALLGPSLLTLMGPPFRSQIWVLLGRWRRGRRESGARGQDASEPPGMRDRPLPKGLQLTVPSLLATEAGQVAPPWGSAWRGQGNWAASLRSCPAAPGSGVPLSSLPLREKREEDSCPCGQSANTSQARGPAQGLSSGRGRTGTATVTRNVLSLPVSLSPHASWRPRLPVWLGWRPTC